MPPSGHCQLCLCHTMSDSRSASSALGMEIQGFQSSLRLIVTAENCGPWAGSPAMQPCWLTGWSPAASQGHRVARISGAQFPFGGRAEPVPGPRVQAVEESFVLSSLASSLHRPGAGAGIVTLKQLILGLVTNSLVAWCSRHALPKFL